MKDTLYGVRVIKLSQGKVALVDEQDYVRVSKYKWRVCENGHTWYALRKTSGKSGKRKTVSLHRYILNAPEGMEVDHINGSGLDCRRANMRLCTRAENARNRKLNSNNTSGYKGVYWNANRNKWCASIKTQYKRISLGLYDDIEDAAHAYDTAAKKYFGEFARLNSSINKETPQ